MSKKNLQPDWKSMLEPMAYSVTREGSTERPFSHPGFPADTNCFLCVCCDQVLFSIDAKYDSGSGWPSFFEPISSTALNEKDDLGHGMIRTEVTCSKCAGHLGHVFTDGPKPTGLRYCINGVALKGKNSMG